MIHKLLHRLTAIPFITTVALLLSSCNGLIYDDEGDCTPHYTVSFFYDRNIKSADAFKNEVNSVSLYVFDKTGNLVWEKTESGDILKTDGYAMEVPVAPGTYDVIAWCHYYKDRATGFTLRGQNSIGTLSDLHCTVDRLRDASGKAYTRSDLHSLYHGSLKSVEFPEKEGRHDFKISLTKNTNTVRVMLQQINGKPLDKDDFDFYLTSANGSMDNFNRLNDNETIDYRAWSKKSGTAGMPELEDRDEDRSGDETITTLSAVVAEMTTARLVKGEPVTLFVTRRGATKPIVRLPVIDYALMVKGEYPRPMSDQDYLDCQDEYPLTFFLDENNDWKKTEGIYVSSWHVVLNSTELNSN